LPDKQGIGCRISKTLAALTVYRVVDAGKRHSSAPIIQNKPAAEDTPFSKPHVTQLQHIRGPWPPSHPYPPHTSPHSLLWMVFPRPALPAPQPAHPAISLPSFQYFLLDVVLRRKRRGDSLHSCCLTSPSPPVAWQDPGHSGPPSVPLSQWPQEVSQVMGGVEGLP
jgi:hypothetical protein